jgi:hypothetical protein
VPSPRARRRHHENPDDVNDLTEWCINKWPIHPGGRNNTQAKLILSLLARRVDPDTIEEVGAQWLAHFKASPDFEAHYQTSLPEAIRLFNDCVDDTTARHALGGLEITGVHLMARQPSRSTPGHGPRWLPPWISCSWRFPIRGAWPLRPSQEIDGRRLVLRSQPDTDLPRHSLSWPQGQARSCPCGCDFPGGTCNRSTSWRWYHPPHRFAGNRNAFFNSRSHYAASPTERVGRRPGRSSRRSMVPARNADSGHDLSRRMFDESVPPVEPVV